MDARITQWRKRKCTRWDLNVEISIKIYNDFLTTWLAVRCANDGCSQGQLDVNTEICHLQTLFNTCCVDIQGLGAVTIKFWKNFSTTAWYWAVLHRMFQHKNVVRSSTSNCNKMLISNSLIKSFQPEHICNTSETANWRGKSKSGNKKSDTKPWTMQWGVISIICYFLITRCHGYNSTTWPCTTVQTL